MLYCKSLIQKKLFFYARLLVWYCCSDVVEQKKVFLVYDTQKIV